MPIRKCKNIEVLRVVLKIVCQRDGIIIFYAIITVSIRMFAFDQTRDDDEFDSTWIGTLVGTISSDSDLSTDNSVREFFGIFSP